MRTSRKRRPRRVSQSHLQRMRTKFAVLQRNGAAQAGKDVWMEAVQTYLRTKIHTAPEDATPNQWVKAAENATTPCDACSASGVYCWGAVVNGRPTNSGTCFRCQGKGRQGQDDYRRNWGYDAHRRAV